MISHFAVSLFTASDSDDDTISSVFLQSDWNEIYSCLADMDLELATHQPCVRHALDVAFPAKIKNDPDSPSFQEAITGEFEDEYWKAMDQEIAGLVCQVHSLHKSKSQISCFANLSILEGNKR